MKLINASVKILLNQLKIQENNICTEFKKIKHLAYKVYQNDENKYMLLSAEQAFKFSHISNKNLNIKQKYIFVTFNDTLILFPS